MCQNTCFRVFVMCCILAVLSGCGAKPDQTENKSGGYLTVEEAKAVVLNHAGLPEEQVRFVRIHLDSDDGAGRYEVEFLCETAEYDYTVDAKTGEILLMNFESGAYDIAAVPAEILPSEEQNDMPSAEAPSGEQNDVPTADMPSAGEQSEEEQYIGIEAAKQIALLHAGLREEEVHFVHAHLEFDDGTWKYDVEFHRGSTEYDYEIDAQSGEVLAYDQDAEYDRHGTEGSQDVRITADEAKRIALEYAGISETQTQGLKAEFDYDDGRAEYEISWYVGRIEYSCDIDAVTGEILSMEREWD